jgi:hypothetical protein
MYIFIATTNKKNTQKREMMDGAGKSCTVAASCILVAWYSSRTRN